MKRGYTLRSGLISILIYLLVVIFLIWAFIKKDKKPQENNETIIKVDMANIATDSQKKEEKIAPQNPPKQVEKNTQEQKKEEVIQPKMTTKTSKPKEEKIAPQNPPKQVEKNTQEQKKEEVIQPKMTTKTSKPKEEKKVQKEIVDAKSDIKSKENNATKKIQKKSNEPLKEQKKETKTAIKSTPSNSPTSLFDDVSVNTPNQTQKSNKATVVKNTSTNTIIFPSSGKSTKASDLLKKESSGSVSSVDSAYQSKVKAILNGWPAQSDYAGNNAKIKFVIEADGTFTFAVVNRSTNEEFNKGLIQYLRQLQRVGFGSHKGNSPYIFNVDFIAKKR